MVPGPVSHLHHAVFQGAGIEEFDGGFIAPGVARKIGHIGKSGGHHGIVLAPQLLLHHANLREPFRRVRRLRNRDEIGAGCILRGQLCRTEDKKQCGDESGRACFQFVSPFIVRDLRYGWQDKTQHRSQPPHISRNPRWS